MTIAVYLVGGFVWRVTTDDNAEHEVFVVEDNKPTRFLWSRHEVVTEITRHCAAAKARTQTYGICVVFEGASEHLMKLSRTQFTDPLQGLAAARGAMRALNERLQQAMSLRLGEI